MPKTKKRRTRAEILVHLSAVLAGSAILGFLAFGALFGTWHMYQKLQNATVAADAAQNQLQNISATDASVKNNIADLTSARGIEAAMREQYGLIKPGEGIIQIVEPAQSAAATTTAKSGTLFAQLFHVFAGW